MTTEERSIKELLAEPFGRDEIKQREGRGGKTFDYIDARSAHQRLDDVVGPGGWESSFKVIDPDSKAVECSLRVCIDGTWVTRTDIGYPNSAADADNDAQEPYKAAYSDALKRAAVQFGIGRHLYAKTPAKREAPPSSPVTQKAFDEAKLRALMVEHAVTYLDLMAVTGKSPTGRPMITQWFEKNPSKSVDDLVAEAKQMKQPA